MTETAEVVRMPLDITAPAERPEQDDELRAEYVRAVRAAVTRATSRVRKADMRETWREPTPDDELLRC